MSHLKSQPSCAETQTLMALSMRPAEKPDGGGSPPWKGPAASARSAPPESPNLRCRRSGRRYYSAAAQAMVERGERCPICGGELELIEPPGR
jgi:hypothetical protein